MGHYGDYGTGATTKINATIDALRKTPRISPFVNRFISGFDITFISAIDAGENEFICDAPVSIVYLKIPGINGEDEDNEPRAACSLRVPTGVKVEDLVDGAALLKKDMTYAGHDIVPVGLELRCEEMPGPEYWIQRKTRETMGDTYMDWDSHLWEELPWHRADCFDDSWPQ
ncbi:uncharacterized protein LTR77_003516 [Saxophila tyrrhenica]|uniref:Uncharacterized protein n=1 Tax=Saxophila tyrrhenica TaxID=1690608 RepID=A0AAV9PI63_9PEZI|nr:hypothetical protein LTR77_003516 [Saxophila tyrrhenica]